jgi:hypothetical protein
VAVALHLQGRMKLFGTHVYPKNKYLTLQMTRSAKGVVCEDVFESLVSVVCNSSSSPLSSSFHDDLHLLNAGAVRNSHFSTAY